MRSAFFVGGAAGEPYTTIFLLQTVVGRGKVNEVFTFRAVRERHGPSVPGNPTFTRSLPLLNRRSTSLDHTHSIIVRNAEGAT